MTNKTTSAIDLVERLNWWGNSASATNPADITKRRLMREAADTITRLQAALRPFAREGAEWADLLPDDQPIQIQEPDDTSVYLAKFNLGDLRRARDAYRSSVGGE